MARGFPHELLASAASPVGNAAARSTIASGTSIAFAIDTEQACHRQPLAIEYMSGHRLNLLIIRVMLGLSAFCLAVITQTAPRPVTFLAHDGDTSGEKCGGHLTAQFIAVGDIMLSRGVDRAMARSGDPSLPFSRLYTELRSTDFNFGNFESPISGDDRRTGKGLVFNTHVHDLSGLVENNFRVLSLANNHALDQGPTGMLSTIHMLARRGILGVGTGNTLEDAWQPKVIDVNGLRIAFIAASYASVNDGGQIRNSFVARTDDLPRLREAVRKAREIGDFVVVAMHAGVEYTRRPDRHQVTFARTAVNAGADIVIGSHPHWVQSIEHYNERPIFYSLGNFIFDQRMPGTTDGLILRVHLVKDRCEEYADARIETLEAIPVRILLGGIPEIGGPAQLVRPPARANITSQR